MVFCSFDVVRFRIFYIEIRRGAVFDRVRREPGIQIIRLISLIAYAYGIIIEQIVKDIFRVGNYMYRYECSPRTKIKTS